MCSVRDGFGIDVPPEVMARAPKTLDALTAWPSFPYDERLSAPRQAGVYAIIIDGTECVYVGTSIDIWRRWQQHHIGGSVKALGQERIHYWLIADDWFRYWMELALMQCFRPLLNGWPIMFTTVERAPDGSKRIRRLTYDEQCAILNA